MNTSVPRRVVVQDSHVIGPLVTGGKAFGTFAWESMPFGSLSTTIGLDGWNETRPGSTLTSQTQTLNAAGQVIATTVMPQAQRYPIPVRPMSELSF